MLAGFFGKKCRHPMADLKSAQLLLDELPKNDAVKSTAEITDWLESVIVEAEFKLVDQLAVVSLLDETAQCYAKKLAHELFSLPDMNSFQGNRLSALLAALSQQTAECYYTIFERCGQLDKLNNGLRSQLPLVVARAIRAMRKQLKYSALHYAPQEEVLWQRLARLCQHAGRQHYLDTTVHLYSATDEGSVCREWVKLLAWYACDLDTLSPQAIHLTERIIVHFSQCIEIKGYLQDVPDCTLAGEGRRGAAATMLRCLEAVPLQSKLSVLLRVLEKERIPAELDLGGSFSADSVLAVARNIATRLFVKSSRKSVRRPFAVALHVVTGYQSVLACCRQEIEAEDGVQWRLENASAGGFLAVPPSCCSVQVGQLLGLQTGRRLGVSIARRLSHDAEGRWHLGAEMLASRVSAVVLRQGGADERAQSALWLHADADDEQGVVRLLMAVNTFFVQRSLTTGFGGKILLLMPGVLLESGADYDLARFRVIEQEVVPAF